MTTRGLAMVAYCTPPVKPLAHVRNMPHLWEGVGTGTKSRRPDCKELVCSPTSTSPFDASLANQLQHG
jgi:hypothetical protein